MNGVEVKAIAMWLLVALGISIPLQPFLGGLVLGLGGSYAAFIATPPKDRLTLWASLLLGLLASLVVAAAHEHLPFELDHLPVQVVMGLAGASSRWIVGAIGQFGRGAMERAGRIPGEIHLPGGKDE